MDTTVPENPPAAAAVAVGNGAAIGRKHGPRIGGARTLMKQARGPVRADLHPGAARPDHDGFRGLPPKGHALGHVLTHHPSELHAFGQVPETSAAILQHDKEEAAIAAQAQPRDGPRHLVLHDVESRTHHGQGDARRLVDAPLVNDRTDDGPDDSALRQRRRWQALHRRPYRQQPDQQRSSGAFPGNSHRRFALVAEEEAWLGVRTERGTRDP